MPKTPGCCVLYCGLVPAKEWIGGEFKMDGRRDGRQIAVTLCGTERLAQSQVAIVRFNGLGELDIGHRVFMRTVDLRLGRQALQLCQRRRHLFRRAFKQSPASTGEKRIAAEQHAVPKVGDVPGSMPGHINDLEGEFEIRDDDAVAFNQRLRSRRNALTGWPIDWYFSTDIQKVQQMINAADVIGMVVRANDGGEFEARGVQVFNHWRRVARIDDGRMATIVDNPQVIVVERWNGMNADCGRWFQAESAKMLP